MELSLMDYLILAGVLQGILVGSAILLVPYFRSKANYYLGAFLVLLGIIIFLAWQDFELVWVDFIWSIMWEYLLVGLLFRYFLEALEHPFRLRPFSWAFFWLFGVTLVVDVAIDLSFIFGFYELPFASDNRHYLFFEEFEDMLTYWLFFLTVVACCFLVWQDREVSAERKHWLWQFCYLLIGIIAVWFLAKAIEAFYGIEGPLVVVLLAMSSIFWWVGYSGVYRLRLAEERSEIRALRKERLAVPAVAGNNKAYEDHLRQLMEREELFRDPDLGRSTVAERLGISEGYLSQQMRDGVGEGFVEYVNGFRIRAARAMLTDGAFHPYSLEAIGREAGFKSRSAFYSSFKKATGQTPGAYRKGDKLS